jgi:hypothetical protein
MKSNNSIISDIDALKREQNKMPCNLFSSYIFLMVSKNLANFAAYFSLVIGAFIA